MGRIKEIFIEIMNENRNVDADDLDYQYEQYLLEQNKIKRDNLRKSLEQDVSDKQVNTVLNNINLK
jgi:hypothetical protein